MSVRPFNCLTVLSLLALSLVVTTAAWAQEQTALYEVTFTATWSAETHPTDFPSGPHFSGLIGATHNDQVAFWESGVEASSGIQRMAEVGSKNPLNGEIQLAIDAGTTGELISGGGITVSPGTISVPFAIERDHPLVTLVSMIAPSPDWFVGVSGLSLLENGAWVNSLNVELFAYDAGTDDGETFQAANEPSDPAEPIRRLTEAPFDDGLPLGTFFFRRTDLEGPALFLRSGRFKITTEWRTPDGQSAFGQPIPLTDDTGYFWFFLETNIEVVIKVLDACGVFNRFWVFAGGLTDVEVEITVEDTATGDVKTYGNEQGVKFQPIQDSNAFATCNALFPAGG